LETPNDICAENKTPGKRFGSSDEDLKINQQFLEKTYLYIQTYLDVKTRLEFMNQEPKM
jgi:hypothetical protein